MTNKLHTSLKTQEIFSSLGQSLSLQPFILSKLAIALSIRKGALALSDFATDNNGLELSRQVIFGDHDLLFRSLIVQNEGRALREEDYFPDLVKAHLDRGAKLLEDEKRYTKDFYNHLCRLARRHKPPCMALICPFCLLFHMKDRDFRFKRCFL